MDLCPSGGGLTPNSTVNDGTVVWTVELTASTKNLNGFVDDGITTTVSSLRRKVYTSSLNLIGGPNESDSPSVNLISKNHSTASSSLKGAIQIIANNGTNSSALVVKPSDVLSWSGNNLGDSAIVDRVLGTNGYIKYKSGLIIQWGIPGIATSNPAEVQYPISFTGEPIVQCTADGYQAGSATNAPSVSTFKSGGTTSFYYRRSTADTGVKWVAIGY